MAASLLMPSLFSLLLVAPVTPSHYYGGRSSVAYEGRNPDGSWKVVFRHRVTFDGCRRLYWGCHANTCGSRVSNTMTSLDTSTNGAIWNTRWCETETVSVRKLWSDRPFSVRADGCCWIFNRYNIYFWRLMASVDLGVRSDTNKPNRSPDVAILPFLRIPQNCPRTYQLIPYDPDDDHVRCRYGYIRNVECSGCYQIPGFQLNEDTCTLRYIHASSNTRPRAFEMMVEDFPRETITLRYTDGHRSTKFPSHLRRRSMTPWMLSTIANPVSTPTPTTRRNQFTTTRPWRTSPTASPVTSSLPWGLGHQTPTVTQPPPTTTLYTTTEPNVTPLGKAPLQFSFLVDLPVPSCQEGLYLPRLLHPTPTQGAHIQAELGRILDITVKAESLWSIITDVIFSGPHGMTKRQTAYGEFALRWIPSSADLGVKAPLCFAVESRLGNQLATTPMHYHYNSRSSTVQYQSEMRCVIIEVHDTVQREVSCGQSSMTVAIEKASLPGLHEDHLRLTDPSNVICSLQTHSNSTHVVASFPLNACGTQIEEDDENLIFKNAITSVENQADIITRKHLLELDFFCEYPKHGNVTLGFQIHRKNVTVWEKGFGTFTYGFEFYDGPTYRDMISPSSYPVEVEVGSPIYMQVEASSSINNTELFVESCRASPYDNPNYRPTYSIIENGCAVDQTVTIPPRAHPNQFRFSMEAFKFIGLHDQVYISCSVLVCERGNPQTRCSRGCVGQNQHYRSRREVSIQSGNHFISQGPLRLKRSAEAATSTDVKLNTNLVFIVGALLAVVAMFSLTSYMKKRISTTQYQPLPTTEN